MNRTKSQEARAKNNLNSNVDSSVFFGLRKKSFKVMDLGKNYRLPVDPKPSGNLHPESLVSNSGPEVRLPISSGSVFGRSRGFTLVELLVSSAIFTAVSMVAVGAILTINDANKKTQAIRAIIDNLNYSLESMSRKLRTGSEYQCGNTAGDWRDGTSDNPPSGVIATSCTSGGTAIAFLSSDNIKAGTAGVITYYRHVKQDSSCLRTLGSATCKGKIQTWTPPSEIGKAGAAVDMTPPEVNIKDLHFYVMADALNQPRVLITLAGIIHLEKEKIDTPFNIQTTVTQRKGSQNTR